MKPIVALLVINLNQLPTSINHFRFLGDSLVLRTAHNLYIDENGYCYVFGSNIQNRGAIIYDLAIPNQPTFAGLYDERYVHDGMVRNDTFWSAEITWGEFSVVDVSDKANPVTLARENTDGAATHNCWISEDNNTLFTTSESKNGPIIAFDVSDLSNITELDQYRSSLGDSLIPHNVHVHGDYLVNSYYRDGVTIVDASRPSNLVEVGNYDTSPFDPAPGFQGCWGAYPFLTSGNILATDRQEGLFVLSPTYVRACYLEGVITDLTNSTPAIGVKAEIVGTDVFEQTNILGEYAIGVADSGSYDLRITDKFCNNLIIPNIDLRPGQVTVVNVDLTCDTLFTGIQPSLDIDAIQVLPNLFDDLATISISHEIKSGQVEIYDVSGRLWQSFEVDEGTSQLVLGDGLTSGTYLVVLRAENSILAQKVVKR